jgi:hypothetical protein
MRPRTATAGYQETVAEYLDRGGVITRVRPSVAKNYLNDETMLGMLLCESFAESDRSESERARVTHEVRAGQRDARTTDADWN